MSIKAEKNKNIKTGQMENFTFEQAYLQYIKPVYIVAYGILKSREDAEDIAHDVFLSYFRIGGSERIRNVSAYLLKTARNKALNYLRKKEREELTDDISDRAVSVIKINGDDNELSVELEKEILSLTLEERQVFMMHVNAGLGFKQISKIMEMSVSAVYRKYRSAIRSLRQALKGGEYNE